MFSQTGCVGKKVEKFAQAARMSTAQRAAMQVDGLDSIDVFASPCPRRVDPRRDSLSVLSERFDDAMLDDANAPAQQQQQQPPQPHHQQHHHQHQHQHHQQQQLYFYAPPPAAVVRVLGVTERARHRLSTDLNASSFSNPNVLQTFTRAHAAMAAAQQDALLRKRSFEIHRDPVRRAHSNEQADEFGVNDVVGNAATQFESDDGVDHAIHGDDDDDDELAGPFDAKVSRSVPNHALHLPVDARDRSDVASMRRRAVSFAIPHANALFFFSHIFFFFFFFFLFFLFQKICVSQSFREHTPCVSQLGTTVSSERVLREDDFSRRTPLSTTSSRVSPMSLGSSLPPSLPSSQASSQSSSVGSSRSSSTMPTPRTSSTSPAVVFERAPSFSFSQRPLPAESPSNDLPRAISSPEVAKMVFAAAVASPSIGAVAVATSSHSSGAGSGPVPRRGSHRRRRMSKRGGAAFTSMIDLRSLQTISREGVFDLDDSQPPSSTESSAPPTRPDTPQAAAIASQQAEISALPSLADALFIREDVDDDDDDDDVPATQVINPIENISEDIPTAHNTPAASPVNANDRTVQSMELMSPTLRALQVIQESEKQQKKQLLQQCSTPPSPKAYVPLLPTVRSAHADLSALSAETMHRVLAGEYSCVQDIIVIDCRFPFEFDGGHIVNALNMHREDLVVSHFFDECQRAALSGEHDDCLSLRVLVVPRTRGDEDVAHIRPFRAPVADARLSGAVPARRRLQALLPAQHQLLHAAGVPRDG
jgi:hypothetical protein